MTAVVANLRIRQLAPNGLRASGPHREFDFWAGVWDVHDENGKLAGRNNVTIEEKRLRRRRALAQRARRHGSKHELLRSEHEALEAALGFGVVLEMDGGMQGDAMIMEGPAHLHQPESHDTAARHVGQAARRPRAAAFHESDDGGKTWKPSFDGYYTRVAAKD